MLKEKDIDAIFSEWYNSLPKKKKKRFDSYNERTTDPKEFRKKKRALGKPLFPKQKYIDISKKQ